MNETKKNIPSATLDVLFAAELFSKLNREEKNQVITLIKSLLSRK